MGLLLCGELRALRLNLANISLGEADMGQRIRDLIPLVQELYQLLDLAAIDNLGADQDSDERQYRGQNHGDRGECGVNRL